MISSKPKVQISEIKKVRVAELTDLIKKNRTILIASIKNIPNSQFQEIVKKLRNKAVVKVPKKNLILKAIDSEKGDIEKIKSKISESIAVLFSNLDPYELAAELIRGKRPAKAKTGQMAPSDIEIPEGPTELVPGPAISELGALGIQIQIEKGKIHIKQSKVIVREGEVIKKNAAELMSKLNIKPFTIGFIPICAFDKNEKMFYSEINIDTEGAIRSLKEAFGKALPFAVGIGYATRDTITFLLTKAGRNEKIIESLLRKEITEEKNGKKEMAENSQTQNKIQEENQ